MTVTKHVKCLFGRDDPEDPEQLFDEELAMEMLTKEAFQLCKSGDEECVTLEDIEKCNNNLGHFINENDIHVPDATDFENLDFNQDGKVCLEEWQAMKGQNLFNWVFFVSIIG